MADQPVKDLTAIGLEILQTARNELYLNLPYLDVALSSLDFRPGGGVTVSVATDGEGVYYDGSFLADRYLRSRTAVNRAYLHMLLHCMLRHLWKKRGKAAELWDLACDAAVESILDDLEYPCLDGGTVPGKQHFYQACRGEMPVLTAEGIYRYLLRQDLPEYEITRLQRAFLVDDHSLWDPEGEDRQKQQKQREEKWKSVSEKTQTGMETMLAGTATGGRTVLEQIRVANRDDVDYRAFLRRFAAPREILAVDGDAFDYIYYTYGLQLYGNMPLVEPPETREERRIEDFVIAVDTSMSTSGELVRQFLSCTYAILRSTETFTRKVNIRILQCDDRVRADTPIHDLRELKGYMENFQLSGGSSTDFRPVFEYVDQLQHQGAFTSLRGLVYFTDGMGIYPKKRPPYEAAFVLLEEPPLAVEMPPWAIRLVVPTPALEQAAREAAEAAGADDGIDLDELPQL